MIALPNEGIHFIPSLWLELSQYYANQKASMGWAPIDQSERGFNRFNPV